MTVDLLGHAVEVALHALPELAVRLGDIVVGRRVVVADDRRRHLKDRAHRVAYPVEGLALHHVLRRGRIGDDVHLARHDLEAADHIGILDGFVDRLLEAVLLLVRHPVLVVEERAGATAAHHGFLVPLGLEADRDDTQCRLKRRQATHRVAGVVVVEVDGRGDGEGRRHRAVRCVLHSGDAARVLVACVLDDVADHGHDDGRQRDRCPGIHARGDRLAFRVHQEPPVLTTQLAVSHAGGQQIRQTHVRVRHLEELADRVLLANLLRVLVGRFPDADRHLTHGLGQCLHARVHDPRIRQRILDLVTPAGRATREADLAKQRVHRLADARALDLLKGEASAGHTLERRRSTLAAHGYHPPTVPKPRRGRMLESSSAKAGDALVVVTARLHKSTYSALFAIATNHRIKPSVLIRRALEEVVRSSFGTTRPPAHRGESKSLKE